jgi:hypothetical protein
MDSYAQFTAATSEKKNKFAHYFSILNHETFFMENIHVHTCTNTHYWYKAHAQGKKKQPAMTFIEKLES